MGNTYNVYLINRYAGMSERILNTQGAETLFLLARDFRREIDVHNHREREAKRERAIGRKWEAQGQAIAYQRSWVQTTEALVALLGLLLGSDEARMVFDMTGAAAGGHYRLGPTDDEMTEEELEAAFARAFA